MSQFKEIQERRVIKNIIRTHTQRHFHKSIILSASEANTKISIKVFFRRKTTNVNQQGPVANTCYILSDNIYCCFISSGGGHKKMKITNVLHFKACVMINTALWWTNWKQIQSSFRGQKWIWLFDYILLNVYFLIANSNLTSKEKWEFQDKSEVILIKLS